MDFTFPAPFLSCSMAVWVSFSSSVAFWETVCSSCFSIVMVTVTSRSSTASFCARSSRPSTTAAGVSAPLTSSLERALAGSVS